MIGFVLSALTYSLEIVFVVQVPVVLLFAKYWAWGTAYQCEQEILEQFPYGEYKGVFHSGW